MVKLLKPVRLHCLQSLPLKDFRYAHFYALVRFALTSVFNVDRNP